MSSAIAVAPPVLELLNSPLRLFCMITMIYSPWVKFESGHLIDIFLLGILQSPSCSVEIKLQIFNAIDVLFQQQHFILNLFFNYDNDVPSWPLCMNIINCLCSIAEGVTTESDVESDAQRCHIRFRAVNLINKVYTSLAMSCGIPGVTDLSCLLDLKKYLLSEKRTVLQRGKFHVDTPVTHPSLFVCNAKSQEFAAMSKISNEVWLQRHEEFLKDRDIKSHAVKLAQSDKIKSALSYLKSNGKSIIEIAQFLFESRGLNKSDVGDILGSDSDRVLSRKQYEELRNCYLKLVDFTNLKFDEALRYFLCSCNFRLPGEAQKVDRMMSAFANRYVADNPTIIPHPDLAYLMGFAV